MLPFRFEREFRATARDFWRAFFDDDCVREQYELIGVRSFEVIERRDDGVTLTRTVHVRPRRDLPDIVQRVFGASLGFTETTVWHRDRDRADTHVTPDMLASRTEIVGSHHVRVVDAGRLLRVFEGRVAFHVPLVGRRLERTVVDEMDASYEQAGDVTQAWIDR